MIQGSNHHSVKWKMNFLGTPQESLECSSIYVEWAIVLDSRIDQTIGAYGCPSTERYPSGDFIPEILPEG
jgi:hypothetical protein